MADLKPHWSWLSHATVYAPPRSLTASLILAPLAALSGWGIFVWGFYRWKERRALQSVPVSKIRDAAMGPVEIQGRAKPYSDLRSPFSGTVCAYFHYKVEESRHQGKNRSWVTVAKGNSGDLPFWIEDETGRALVKPKGCEAEIPVTQQYSNSLFDGTKIPDQALQFLASQGHSVHTWLGTTRTLRFSEHCIAAGDQVFALGVAAPPGEDRRLLRDEAIAARAHLAKPSAGIPFSGTAAKNLSPEMWEQAREKIAKEVDAELEQSLPRWVLSGDGTNYFILSNRSTKEVIRKLGWEAVGSIALGAALGTVGTVYTGSLLAG